MTKQVLTFHYTLTDKTGKMHDTSAGAEPLTFLEGSGHIIPGLEKALLKLKQGDKEKITVAYAEGYGAYDQSLIYQVARTKFPNEQIQIGDMFQIGKGDRYQIVTVVEVTDEQITLDSNHPLAGKDLIFAVEVLEMRPATDDEITHGHVHGQGGHHH